MIYQYTANYSSADERVTATYTDAEQLMDDLEERDYYVMTGALPEQTTVECIDDGRILWRVVKGSKQGIYESVREKLNGSRR